MLSKPHPPTTLFFFSFVTLLPYWLFTLLLILFDIPIVYQTDPESRNAGFMIQEFGYLLAGLMNVFALLILAACLTNTCYEFIKNRKKPQTIKVLQFNWALFYVGFMTQLVIRHYLGVFFFH